MSFRINSGMGGFSSYQLQKSQQNLSQSLQRLSTGKRINRASDDAAGMVIANKLESQARGFGQAIKNANDAISIVQVADGAYEQSAQLVQDIRVKAIQAANAAQSPSSRKAIQADIDKSLEALSQIADNTSFNSQKLLSGSFTDKQFQVGAGSGETVSISLGSIDPSQIGDSSSGVLSDIDVTTDEGAQKAIEMADAALDYISGQRSNTGSIHNQLTSTVNNLSNSRINTIAAQSQISDLDYAEESMNLERIKLLSKARSYALSKVNENSKSIINIFE